MALGCSGGSENTEKTRGALDANAAIVVRQIYGGGSNANAPYAYDFIELFNRSGATVSLSGWSLQYASATGTGHFGATASQLTELPNIVLEPGQSFLVQEAGSGTVGSSLPTPDFIDPTPINLSASAGKVVLVRTPISLGCNGSTATCSAEADALIVDLVGYGTANYAEGQAAVATDNSHSLVRESGGCNDSNLNANDFSLSAPNPRNSQEALAPCQPNGGAGGSGGTGSGTVGGATSGGTTSAVGGTTTHSTEPGPIRISDIQGRAHRSPLEGTVVSRVPGVVTVVRSDGFFMQSMTSDADPATSEGVFVFTSSKPRVLPKDSVLVTGTVSEYRPGCNNCGASSSSYSNLSTTEIARPTEITVIGQEASLPPFTNIGQSGRVPPTEVIDKDGVADVESPQANFNPIRDGIDFYESLEGMLVEVNDAVVVGPTNSFGELPVIADSGSYATSRSSRGGVIVKENDFNPERIILDSDVMPTANVGDTFTSPVEGVLEYSYGNYKVTITGSLPTLKPSDNAKESTNLGKREANEIDVASLNVENLNLKDPDEKFSKLAQIIVQNLGSPDIVTLEEVQDDSGASDDGTVAAGQTIGKLTDAIIAAGGPQYDHRSIDPENDQDGGESGGNIRVVFLFRIDGDLAFVDRAGANATTANSVVGSEGEPRLAFSPGRLEATNPAFANSRKPLAAEFQFNGQTLFVIGNHFNSKGGDTPLFGRFQPPVLSSEQQRLAQARIVADFVKSITAVDSNAKIVVLGDLNDFEFSAPVKTIEAVNMTALISTLPENERYTYVYEGNSQALDQVLVSPSLLSTLQDFDVVHVNSEFADQVSDHDPAVARFMIGDQPTKKIIPILDCVKRLGALSYVAYFGYNNPNQLSVSRPVGKKNEFVTSPTDRGQPTHFAPGEYHRAFEVPFRGGLLGWWLDDTIYVASMFSPRCP
jgi:predicted extracellular nuclease